MKRSEKLSQSNNSEMLDDLADLFYNIACIHALIENNQDAVENLMRAAEIKSDYINKAVDEEDLKSIKSSGELKKVFEDLSILNNDDDLNVANDW